MKMIKNEFISLLDQIGSINKENLKKAAKENKRFHAKESLRDTINEHLMTIVQAADIGEVRVSIRNTTFTDARVMRFIRIHTDLEAVEVGLDIMYSWE